MDRLRVLFVLSELDIGGPQKSLLALLDRLDYQRIDASIYLMEPGGDLLPFVNEKVRVLDSDKLIHAATIPSHGTAQALLTLLAYGRVAMLSAVLLAIARHVLLGDDMNRHRQRIWRRFSSRMPHIKGSYDLVFGIQGLASYCAVDCVDARVRYHWIRSDTRVLARDEEIDADYYMKMQGALAVGEKPAGIFEEMYPCMRGRVRVFYNHVPVHLYQRMPADTGPLSACDGFVNLLTICRLDPLKGLDLAVEACRLLIDRGLRFRWFVLGEGSARPMVEQLIDATGVGSHFHLLGHQLNTLAFIEACDVLVHPSRTEGKSNVVDEAKFAGKPIVVTRYETVSDQVVDGVDGLVCDLTALAVADAIERLYQDVDLRSRLGAANKGREDGVADVAAFFEALVEEST